MSMKNQIPAPVVTAVTAMLTPFCPDLSATGLIEALGNHNTPPAEPTIRKPLTRAEAAEILQVSINSINRYIKAGILRASKIGKRLVRIDPTSVAALLQTQTTPADEPEA